MKLATFLRGFFSMGFRPFFLFAVIWALLAMVLWLPMLTGKLKLPSVFDAVSWHAHEALFGYLSAVLSGFLLTAVPNWTGRPPLAGSPLACLLMLWVLGRIAVAVSAWLTPLAVALIDVSCLVVLGCYALREIIISRNWRNLVVIAMIIVFVAGDLLFHLEAAEDKYAAAGLGLRLGLAAAIMMISVIGGRIVPTFTRNWLVKRGSEVLPAKFGRLDGLALALTLIALAVWVALPKVPMTGYLLFVAGLAQTVRLLRWRGWETGHEPLLWVLHLGYAFIPIGMLSLGTTLISPYTLTLAPAQHLWMAGAIGVMTLGVMTRATLGHSGQELTAGKSTALVYLLVVASVFARAISGVLLEHAMVLWILAAALWSCGFAGFLLLYGRLLIVGERR